MSETLCHPYAPDFLACVGVEATPMTRSPYEPSDAPLPIETAARDVPEPHMGVLLTLAAGALWRRARAVSR